MPRYPRAQTEQAERRRRRSDPDALTGRRLAVDTTRLDPNYEYRWINDDPGRIEALTVHDDWDIVTDTDLKPGTDTPGSQVSTVVGTSANGAGKRAYLARKPKAFYQEDTAAKQRALDETDNALRRGTLANSATETRAMSGHAYVPSGGISIKESHQG